MTIHFSLNKKFTGKKNPDFNQRHDWNSLLGDTGGPIFTQYSDDLFPHADCLLQYLQDYANYYKLNIKYQQNVDRVNYVSSDTKYKLKMTNLSYHDVPYSQWQLSCRYLLMANGLDKVIRPFWADEQLWDYSNM